MRTRCATLLKCYKHWLPGRGLKVNGMKPNDFKRWRKSVGLSQKDAAHALGVKRRVIQYYEKGERDGKKIEIPLYIRLACAAYSDGHMDYHGPADGSGKPHVPEKTEIPLD